MKRGLLEDVDVDERGY